MKLKNSEYKMLAAIHGIDVNNKKEGSHNDSQSRVQKQPPNQTLPLFRDPSEYAHMSQEERQALTEKMKSQHESWVKKGKLPKG